jgi:hypothetical protein
LIEQRAGNGDPIAFWQLRQWQMRTLIGSPSHLNRTAPHRHPPSLIMASPLAVPGRRLISAEPDAFELHRQAIGVHRRAPHSPLLPDRALCDLHHVLEREQLVLPPREKDAVA